MSQEVAKRPESVPDLHHTAASTITSDDIALPRIYLGQYMSSAVQEGLVKAGAIFSATGQNDPDPQLLWSPPASEENPGVLFHVLSLRKGKSWTEGPGSELELFDFDDPNAPADAWITFNYVVLAPDFDEFVPFKLLLTRTGKNAALQINTVLKKGEVVGHGRYESAFHLTASPRENNKGKWFVPRVSVAKPTKKHVELAAGMAKDMATSVIDQPATGEQPKI